MQDGTSHESRDSLGGWDVVLQSWKRSLNLGPLDVAHIRGHLVAYLLENSGRLFALLSEMEKNPLPLPLAGSAHKQFQVKGDQVAAVGMYFKTCRNLRKRDKFALDDAPVTQLASIAYNSKKKYHQGFQDQVLGQFVQSALMHTAWNAWTNSEKGKQAAFDARLALNLCRSYIGHMYMAILWLKNPDVWHLRQNLGDRIHTLSGREGPWPHFLNGAVAPKRKGKERASAKDTQNDPEADWIANTVIDNKMIADQKKLQKIVDLVKQVGGVKDEKGNLLVSESVRDLTQSLITVRVKLNQSNVTSLTFIILGTCT